MPSPRIAVCQDWVMTWSGSDQVAGRIAAALDAEHIYTYAARPDLLQRLFGSTPVTTSRLGTSAFAQKRWDALLPLMARWWRSLDLSGYDAVIACSHSTVNSIRTPPGVPHISYCSTPMRYAWNWRAELGRVPNVLRPAWPAIAAGLRRADRRRSRNVDVFIANSHNVAGRIGSSYGRSSVVVHPPIDTDTFTPGPRLDVDPFFLYAGRLVAYKRPDLAIAAAERAGVRLVVAGDGPELPRLRAMAGPNTTFEVSPDDARLRDLYRSAEALVFPGEEDFGMVMVEAQACGTPVIALGLGGALETIEDGTTGTLYAEPTVHALAAAITSHRRDRFDPNVLRSHAVTFSAQRFDDEIRAIVAERLRQ